MITKRQLVLNLIEEDKNEDAFHGIYRVARVLGISSRQVVRYLLTEEKWQPKPRKPKVRR